MWTFDKCWGVGGGGGRRACNLVRCLQREGRKCRGSIQPGSVQMAVCYILYSFRLLYIYKLWPSLRQCQVPLFKCILTHSHLISRALVCVYLRFN